MTHTIDAADVNFMKIKDIIGNCLNLHIFEVSNGYTIHAKVKVTTRRGLIHTCYLHVIIISPNGKMQIFREQADGNFKQQ